MHLLWNQTLKSLKQQGKHKLPTFSLMPSFSRSKQVQALLEELEKANDVGFVNLNSQTTRNVVIIHVLSLPHYVAFGCLREFRCH